MPHAADRTNSLPPTCDVAFKEWAAVCEALESGLQTIILRKGGIEDGPHGFVPEHQVFWLYPTRVHQAEQGLRRAGSTPTEGAPAVPDGVIEIGTLARVERVGLVERVERLDALEGFHVWTSETVRKRFHYRRPGLWVLGVRVFRGRAPWRVAVTPEQAGCKTWVPLDRPLVTEGLRPVLEAAEFDARMDRLEAALGPPGDG